MTNIIEQYKDNWARNQGDTEEKETPEYWGKMSVAFAQKSHSPNSRKDVEDFINRFKWSENETVLDVGAGPGTHAIPLSRRVKQVTAVDFSKEMLEQLHIQAEKENADNISLVCGRWLEVSFDRQFDTILCLNSLGVITSDANHESKLLETLKKLDSLTKRRLAILIPHADTALDSEMLKILKISETPTERRRIAVLYSAMVDSGMLPSLEIISRPFMWVFNSVEEAVEKMLQKANLPLVSNEAKNDLRAYISKILKKNENGLYSLSYNTKQALFTYIKN